MLQNTKFTNIYNNKEINCKKILEQRNDFYILKK